MRPRGHDSPGGASLIGIDWGTTALRAYLIEADGRIADRRDSGHGLRALPSGGFPEALGQAVRGWPEDLPILMCGMVGSRSGWREAPYLDVSAGVALADLARGVVAVGSEAPGARIMRVVPGVRTGDAAAPDVMRGEETQVLGVLTDGVALLPGTHSKLVRVARGRITGFRTAMTGEVYAALARHTILADTGGAPADAAEARLGFAAGLEAARALEAPGDLLQRLFSIRASVLIGRMPGGQAGEFLSGLLIGAEVAAARLPAGGRVHVIGGAALAERYAVALEAFGAAPVIGPPDAAATGLHAIARLFEKGPDA